ncbi:MAG: gliding motility protein GldM [Prolixibacteraceae bacterium]|nr:gliding motility protein GldM [Prolixibacteraceae bacterium]
MGTKNCPETPRQRMINMMYLVLTAMLALNVSKEILNAFKIVDSSLLKTYSSFNSKNASLVGDFDRAYELNKEKVGKWRDLAREVQNETDDLINYIIETKELLANKAGAYVKAPDEEIGVEDAFIVGLKKDTIIIKSQEDLNASPEIMLTKGRGKELQEKVNSYKQRISELLEGNPMIMESLNQTLDVDDPERGNLKIENSKNTNYRTWPQKNFEASPVIASLTLLSKLQIDVCNAESAVLRHLYNEIDASSFKFTGLKATVIPDASYVFQGQQYRARIFIAAEDTTQELKVYIGGSSSPLPTEGNEAIYTINTSKPGIYTYSGEIRYKNPQGEEGSRKFEGEYQVAVPAVTISPTKMNVMYRGLPNPVSISVPGIPSSDLEVSFTNGSISKSGESWIAEPRELDYKGEKTKIIVNAKIDGKLKNMGEMIFRVKKVPDPKATVARLSTGTIERERLQAQVGVFATLEDFDFDLAFEVVGFDMSVPTSGGLTTTLPSSSYKFTDAQKRLLNGLGAGDKVSFENVKAKIEGDKNDPVRILSPIILTVQ